MRSTREFRPTMYSRPLELNVTCDICGRGRSSGKHAACSRQRQERWAAEWAAVAAAKQTKGNRHVH